MKCSAIECVVLAEDGGLVLVEFSIELSGKLVPPVSGAEQASLVVLSLPSFPVRVRVSGGPRVGLFTFPSVQSWSLAIESSLMAQEFHLQVVQPEGLFGPSLKSL